MKTTLGFSKNELNEFNNGFNEGHDKYSVYLYLAIIAALLAVMVLTQFGTAFYK